MSEKNTKPNWDRKFTRYTVSGLENFRCYLEQRETPEMLVSISKGGFGIYQTADNLHLQFKSAKESAELHGMEKPFIRKTIRIEYPKVFVSPLTMQANLVSAREMSVQDKTIYYLGFQFLPTETQKIDKLIHHLEELRLEGKIKEH